MSRRIDLAAGAVALALTGCTAPSFPEGTVLPTDPPTTTRTARPTTDQGQPPPRRVRRAHATLARLDVVARDPLVADYERDAFGTPWKDTDGNGCNQRDDVLLRDVAPGTVRVAQQGRCDHDVLAGRWRDPFTGRLLAFTDLKDARQAQAIQIDHVVPLGEAWRSGAAGWTDDRREVYANDLRLLLAVDGPTNASKGDDDPAAWKPRKGFQCWYAVTWVETKSRWQLGADASEVRGVEEMLDRC